MVQVQLKLKLRPAQERLLGRWLWHLTGVWNWSIRKIQLDADNTIYHTAYGLKALLNGHAATMKMPVDVLGWTAANAHQAWDRCFRGWAARPRLKGQRNKLNSIPFSRSTSLVVLPDNRVRLLGLGHLRYHAQEIPPGHVKGGRLVRRASGWYLCLFIEADSRQIPHVSNGEVGIDPGFTHLITLSDGEKVQHPQEIRQGAARLAQSQRGHRKRLTARLLERQGNRRKDRNHKLSRRLVAENSLIAWSKDSHQSIARTFGKSVASAAHGQLRTMLAYKCRSGGRRFVEASNRYSTKTCSACGARSGPTGYAGLSVRQWQCGCGATHDRDCNAAVNTLFAARGMRVERGREIATGIAP